MDKVWIVVEQTFGILKLTAFWDEAKAEAYADKLHREDDRYAVHVEEVEVLK